VVATAKLDRRLTGKRVGSIERDEAALSARPLLAAWAATLLLSRLPEIVLREGLKIDTPWMGAYPIICSLLLVIASFVLRQLAPLRPYFIVLLAVLVLTTVVDPLIRGLGLLPVVVLDDGGSVMQPIGERMLLALEALALIALLGALGFRGRDAFVAVGDLNGRAGIPQPGRSDRQMVWTVLGPIAALGLFGLTAAFVFSSIDVAPDIASRAVPLVPFALLAAGLNAFGEEILYRAGPLAPLGRVVGRGHATWMLALWFGLGHFYGGIPSGVAALVFATATALLFTKAMLDTRGLVWPWVLHFAADAAIFIFLAIVAIRGA
jgi:membrane protease YdiL (CAAX protease family)